MDKEQYEQIFHGSVEELDQFIWDEANHIQDFYLRPAALGEKYRYLVYQDIPVPCSDEEKQSLGIPEHVTGAVRLEHQRHGTLTLKHLKQDRAKWICEALTPECRSFAIALSQLIVDLDHPAKTVGQKEGTTARPEQPDNNKHDSGHFAYGRLDRENIVKRFRSDRREGKIIKKDSWAQSNYQITGKTLLSYEKEFPVTEA